MKEPTLKLVGEGTYGILGEIVLTRAGAKRVHETIIAWLEDNDD